MRYWLKCNCCVVNDIESQMLLNLSHGSEAIRLSALQSVVLVSFLSSSPTEGFENGVHKSTLKKALNTKGIV